MHRIISSPRGGPVRIQHIFPYYLIQCDFRGGRGDFSTTFVWKFSHPIKNSAVYIIINVPKRSRKLPVFLARFQTLSLKIFKILRHQMSWKSVMWEPRRIVRTDEANSRVLQYCECAWKWRLPLIHTIAHLRLLG